ncbi:MAG: DNA-binding protein [Gammaproteobacteria bacterium]|nr:DNA-binding protein [Gammaproteobacteria bacterium]
MREINKKVFRESSPEILVDLAGVASRIAIESLDMDKDIAEEFGIDVAVSMAKNWAGQQLYIPSNLKFNLSMRDRQIWDEFNGFNQNQLAKKYGISVPWVYKIIKRTREAIHKESQPSLFE